MSFEALKSNLAHGFREVVSTKEEKEIRKALSDAVPICIIVCVALAALSFLVILAYPTVPTALIAVINIVICYDLAMVAYHIKQITDDAKEHISLKVKGPKAMAEYIVSYTVLARFFSGVIEEELSKKSSVL